METNDKSLLRCTIKKSTDVMKKLAKYAAYILGTLIAGILALYGALGVWAIAADPVYKIVDSIVSFLFSIPWYCYAGIVAIAAIPVYSLLWCVTRELTEEDWKSDEAKILALAIAFAIAIAAIAIASIAAIAFASIAAIAFASIAAIAFALAIDSKAFRFIGAYLHYRKRVKAE
jgi:hypothetical protein